MLDADLSSRALLEVINRHSHDVVAAGLVPDLKQLDDPPLFAVAQEQKRIMITHNVHDYPDILRDWADAGRSHHGSILSHVPTNAYGEMERRLQRWFDRYPRAEDWTDLAVIL